MAVVESTTPSVSTGRRIGIGTNVVVTIMLVAGIVVVAQLLAYRAGWRHDMTSARVNSLSDGTEHLLGSLDTNVRLTSLYFETDREDEDQSRYRQASRNLLDLYEATNRSKITSDWINPLKDQEKMLTLTARLRGLPVYKDAVDAYKARVDQYRQTLDAKMRKLVQSETDRIASFGGSLGGGSTRALVVLQNLFEQLTNRLSSSRDRIDTLAMDDNPQYGAAVDELRSLYGEISKWLKDVGRFGSEQTAKDPSLPGDQAQYLREVGQRCAEVVGAIEAETTQLEDIKPLKVEDVLRKLGPTNNAILVETPDDARVVEFASVWPPIQQGTGARARFDQRAFKGEEKLTSAILRVTHKEQTAVVFVHYGGPPLFLGGFLPNQPPAPYATMQKQLEDANFITKEWDLKTDNTPPTIDPAPTRTIYVVFKPSPPRRGPMGRPGQEPPFSDAERKTLLDAIGENGRALFVVGWAPGPFGPIPSPYEYGDYLKNQWGITSDASALLFGAVSTAPGQYGVNPRSFYLMSDLDVTDHAIVRGASGRQVVLPWCAPLYLAEKPPEGVHYDKLITQPKRDGVWGVKNIQKYQQQLEQHDYLTRAEGDMEGPFDLAVAATKGNAKIVVVGSREFAVDQVAFSREMVMGPQGFSIRSRNPGNVTLFVNSLHWLNDNTEFMNIGRPIDAAVLEIKNKSTEKMFQAITIFVWPVLALLTGGVTWLIRRR